jgi:hypothetical protein
MGERLEAVFALCVNMLDARALGWSNSLLNITIIENFDHSAPRGCQEFLPALSSGIIHSVSRLVAAEMFYNLAEFPEKLRLDFLHQPRIG